MLPPRRVLLADDDLEVRHGVADLLGPLGLEFLHAESGLEARELISLHHRGLHLLVLDMHMPGCSGLEVLDFVRTELVDRRLPTICYSADATPQVQSRALELGAFAFLTKPVQPEQLRSEVLRALAG